MNTILVTGGAGYIGSHVVQQLSQRGERVIVLDNLVSGFREAVRGAELVVGDVGDRSLVARIMTEHRIGAVLHFAAHTVVPESVRDPLKYYGNDTCNTRNLLACCVDAGVRRFLFSSTAAVYGMPASGIADEDTPVQPINPYGSSKLMSETMLRDLGSAGAMQYVILRYFNVAGCDPQGRIGQSTPNATLLLKVACEHAVSQHGLGTATGFLGRLANEHQRALPLVLERDESSCGPDPTRHVDVMPATVRDKSLAAIPVGLDFAGIG